MNRFCLIWIMMVTVAVLPSVAQDPTAALTFKPEMLSQMGKNLRVVEVEKAFESFTPTTPEQVDWCYLVFSRDVPSRQIKASAQKKLAALREPALLAASRKHLFDNEKMQVKAAMENIVATNDQAALPDLCKLESLQTEPAKHVYYLVRQTRAKLHDPELLKELADPKKQTPDSTLASYNRELLKEYGAEGTKLLLAMEQSSPASKEQVNKYLSEVKDEKQVQELLSRYNGTSLLRNSKEDAERKSAILQSLIKINSRECQPLFREILAKSEEEQKAMGAGVFNLQKIVMCVWRYNTKENEKLQDQYLKNVKSEDNAIMHELNWQQYKDKTPEMALILSEKLKNPKNGYLAAEALKRLTGQQFQYAAQLSNGVRDNDNQKISKTSMTVEKIEQCRQEDLRNMNAHLAEVKKSGKYQKIYEKYSKAHLDAINKQYDDLLISAKKPAEWEQGIQLDEASQWIMNYYHIQAKENVGGNK